MTAPYFCDRDTCHGCASGEDVCDAEVAWYENAEIELGYVKDEGNQ